MAEQKRAVARIDIPPRSTQPVNGANEAGRNSESAGGVETSRTLMSRLQPAQRDPWIVPLVGLLLAFSVVSLIVQLLIAFS
jgi:hypothetical protein